MTLQTKEELLSIIDKKLADIWIQSFKDDSYKTLPNGQTVILAIEVIHYRLNIARYVVENYIENI